MEFYTPDSFTCAVTYSRPNAAWKSYYAEADRYYIYGMCGKKTTQKIIGSALQDSCSSVSLTSLKGKMNSESKNDSF